MRNLSTKIAPLLAATALLTTPGCKNQCEPYDHAGANTSAIQETTKVAALNEVERTKRMTHIGPWIDPLEARIEALENIHAADNNKKLLQILKPLLQITDIILPITSDNCSKEYKLGNMTVSFSRYENKDHDMKRMGIGLHELTDEDEGVSFGILIESDVPITADTSPKHMGFHVLENGIITPDKKIMDSTKKYVDQIKRILSRVQGGPQSIECT